MLYDILPPIILFLSFGGIIAIVSRVMLRVRRQEISQQIQNEVASQESVAEDRIFKKPGIAGITLVKNRLLLIPHMLKNSITQTKTLVHEKIEARKERKAQQEEPVAPEEQSEAAEEEENNGMRVQMPTQSWRDRLAATKEKVLSALPKRKEIPEEPMMVTTAVPLQQEEQEEIQPAAEEKPQGKPSIRLRRVENEQKGESDSQVAPAPQVSPEEVKKTIEKTIEDQKPTPEKEQSRLIQKLLRKSEAKRTPIETAMLALEDKEFGRAEDVLVPYIMKHTRDAKAYMLLGQAAIGRESWDEAIEIFQQVMKIDETQKGAYAALGAAAMNAGKVTLALQSLQRAHDEDPTNIQVLERLLTLAQRMDNKVLQRSVTEELAILKPQQAEEKRVKVTS